MIGNKLEQSIIGVFQENLSSTYSINQISKVLKKSYPLINKKSNFFLQEGVLKKIDIGRSYQCFLNMRNEKARVLMAVNELNKKEELIRKITGFDNILDEILQLAKRFSIDTVILYKKTLIFVTSGIEHKDTIMELSVLTKDYNILFFDRKGFQERFTADMDLQKYHFVLYNVDIYLNMISEVSEKLLVTGLMQSNQEKKGEFNAKRQS
ncbi:MAG: hypothetical protein ACP5OA_01240 [Candidatus Woesearchaeota archaeon]